MKSKKAFSYSYISADLDANWKKENINDKEGDMATNLKIIINNT